MSSDRSPARDTTSWIMLSPLEMYFGMPRYDHAERMWRITVAGDIYSADSVDGCWRMVQALDTETSDTVREESLHPDFAHHPDRHKINQYHEISLATEYLFEMREEYDYENTEEHYSQQCTPGRYADSCRFYREEVAEQWANDHVLLLIEYQEFEIVKVTTNFRATLNELIGSIGGNIGLFMGGSILSMIHMAVFILQWLFCCGGPADEGEDEQDRLDASPQDIGTDLTDCNDHHGHHHLALPTSGKSYLVAATGDEKLKLNHHSNCDSLEKKLEDLQDDYRHFKARIERQMINNNSFDHDEFVTATATAAYVRRRGAGGPSEAGGSYRGSEGSPLITTSSTRSTQQPGRTAVIV